VQRPGVRVVFNFAAADILATQIVKGAPADVFASADQGAMNRSENAGVIETASRRDFVGVVFQPATGLDATAIAQVQARVRQRLLRVLRSTPNRGRTRLPPLGRHRTATTRAGTSVTST
jgi:hypothetical protein